MASLDDMLRTEMRFSLAESIGIKAHLVAANLRLRSHLMWEKWTEGRPLGPRDIPGNSEAITPEWLTGVMRHRYPGAQALSVVVDGGSEGSASRARLKVEWNEAGRQAGLPQRLFNKTTRSFEQRFMLGLVGGIECEAGFYQKIRPGLDLETPNSYFVKADPASGRSVFLLEDIGVTRNASFCTPVTPVDRARAEDLIGLLARFHAALWDDPRLDTEFAWLQAPRERYRRIESLVGLESNIPLGVQRSWAVIPPDVQRRLGEFPRCYARSLELKSQKPYTFLHGDAHVGNFYLTGEGRMGICDWQISQKGQWYHDVAYAIISALTPEDRRLWERDLLALYLDRLRAYGVTEAPSFDAAWRVYRQDSLYCWYAWVTTIGHNANQPDMQPDAISLAIIKRASIAISDLDALDSFDD